MNGFPFREYFGATANAAELYSIRIQPELIASAFGANCTGNDLAAWERQAYFIHRCYRLAVPQVFQSGCC